MWKALLPAIASRTQCSSSFCWLAQVRRAGRFVFIINGRMHFCFYLQKEIDAVRVTNREGQVIVSEEEESPMPMGWIRIWLLGRGPVIRLLQRSWSGGIRKKLDKWDVLPPDEQEKLCRRFHKNRN